MREFLVRYVQATGASAPGRWDIKATRSRNRLTIAKYEQYMHVVALLEAAKKDKQLAAALGSDYTITPDIIIAREPKTTL